MNAYKQEYWCCGECDTEYDTEDEANECCSEEEEEEEPIEEEAE